MSKALVEDVIKDSLISLLAGIKAADGTAIGREMARLDEMVEKEAGAMDPRLAHFLQRRSYAKALELLGGEKPAAGTCGPKDGPR